MEQPGEKSHLPLYRLDWRPFRDHLNGSYGPEEAGLIKEGAPMSIPAFSMRIAASSAHPLQTAKIAPRPQQFAVP